MAEEVLLRPSRLRIIAETGSAFAAVFCVMSAIQFAGPAILDNDGYYHIRWTALIRESAPRLPEFRWLPLTSLNAADYADHHLLYHALLTPFTLGDLRLGAKVAAAAFSSLALALIFGLMARDNVPFRWLWLVPLTASSEPFLYRMSMTRAPALSLALLAIGIYFLTKRRLLLLGLLGFLFVWSYSLFPLLFFFAAAHAATTYLAERRIDLWPTMATVAGVVLGLLLNPYFPDNVILFVKHVAMKYATDYDVNVGIEWYPYDTQVILRENAVAFAFYLAGLVAFDFKSRRRNPASLFLLIVSTLLLILFFKSRRFVEYWPPFAVLFAAFTITPRILHVDWSWLERRRDKVIAATTAVCLGVALTIAMLATLGNARAAVSSELDPYAYRGASEWLAQNTEPGSLVFNTDWDDFPMLFYYNTHNSYVAGLDPTYLYERDPELWRLYAAITLGEEANPGPLIRERFGAKYVFTDNNHPEFIGIATASGEFETVYHDRYSTVFRLLGSEH